MEKKSKDKEYKNVCKEVLRVIGAKENNLKNVSVDIPKNTLAVITGLSGSGKSSLAFDVIHAEGQRRFLEGMSSYARNVLDIRSKPDVDAIERLSPTIAIDQKNIGRSPRSTVGTLSEISDYFRTLFACYGSVHCPHCKKILERKTVREMMEDIVDRWKGSEIDIVGVLEKNDGKEEEKLERYQHAGYTKGKVNNREVSLEEMKLLLKNGELKKGEVVVDRLRIDKKRPDRERIMDSLEAVFGEGNELAFVSCGEEQISYRRDWFCEDCCVCVPELTAKHFSFNHPEGACSFCGGLGERQTLDPNQIVTSKRLTLEEGALGSLTRFLGRTSSRSSFYRTLEVFARSQDIDLLLDVEHMPKEHFNLLLHSSKKTKNDFEGIIPFLERKYRESTSQNMRLEIEKCMHTKKCDECQGRRLRKESLAVTFSGKNLYQWGELPLRDLERISRDILHKEEKGERSSLYGIFQEITLRSRILNDVGVGYLTLGRTTMTISGGEAQRIRLAVQLVSELSGVLYILDEPSRGLHPRDTHQLIETLNRLRRAGNSVLVVEHDRDIIEASDWIVDVGPGAGEEGGEIIFSGEKNDLWESQTLTAQYLRGDRSFIRKNTPRLGKEFLTVTGAQQNNLKNITVNIPLECMTVITGVSGSGKSTFVHQILSRALKRRLYNTKDDPGKYETLSGADSIDKVITMTQSPIGRTSRSNVATYTGIFSLIREVFAQVPQAKSRHFGSAHFSFNLKGGRCESCHGEGVRKIEMYLLPDRYAECEVCRGTRYARETLDVKYKGETIADVLDMSVSYAKVFFAEHGLIQEKLDVLEKVGLGYLRLGQGAPDLSGGEAQRIKLATELARKSTGDTLYILDEPTVGLHFEDIRLLLEVLDDLVKKGNTVIMVEHNIDVIRHADHIIDFGPEGGDGGGEIVCVGSPEEIRLCKQSQTGRFL